MDFCLHHHVEYGRDDDTDYGPRVRKRAAEPAGGNGLAVVADIDGRVARVQGNLERFLNTSYRSIELLFARSRGFEIMFKAVGHFAIPCVLVYKFINIYGETKGFVCFP